MKKQLHTIIILLTIGFFMLPTTSDACGTKTEKSCCEKEKTEKKEKKDCCNNKQLKDKSCGGKCGHSNCTSSSVNFSIISSNEINHKSNSFDFFAEKSKFHHSKLFLSSGFYSIWLIPKIS